MDGHEQSVREFVERFIRPRVRVDGGDVRFESLRDGRLTLTALADCAGCPAANGCLQWWIERELATAFAASITVELVHCKPYFA